MERMVSQRLMPSEYYMATAWEWKQLNKVELGDLTYGNLCIDGTMAVLENTEAQPSEFDFKNMLYMGVRNGYMEQASYLYRAFRYNVQNFQGLFNLEEDGCIKARNVFEVEEVYSIASALFTNMLNSGRHVTQWIEDRITELYGKNLKEYQCWKRCTSAFFDESLAYALCDSLRNTAVHKALMLSVVNYRPDINMVGIALNIEAGMLLDSKLNGNLKKRIRAFRDERR